MNSYVTQFDCLIPETLIVKRQCSGFPLKTVRRCLQEKLRGLIKQEGKVHTVGQRNSPLVYIYVVFKSKICNSSNYSQKYIYIFTLLSSPFSFSSQKKTPFKNLRYTGLKV